MRLTPEDLLAEGEFRRQCTSSSQTHREWGSCQKCGEAYCTALCLSCSPEVSADEAEVIFRQAVENTLTLLNEGIPEGFPVLPSEVEQRAFEPILSAPLARAWKVLKCECRLREAIVGGDVEAIDRLMGESLDMVSKETAMLRSAISDASDCRKNIRDIVLTFVTRIKELQLFSTGHNAEPVVQAWKTLQRRIPRWSSLRAIIERLAQDFLLVRGHLVMESLASATLVSEGQSHFSLMALLLHGLESKDPVKLHRAIEKASSTSSVDLPLLSRAITTLVWEAKLLIAAVCRDMVGMKATLKQVESLWDSEDVYQSRYLYDAEEATRTVIRRLAKSSLENATDLSRLHTAIIQGEELGFSESKVADAKVRYFDEFLRSALTEAQSIVQWQYNDVGWKDFGLQLCVDLEFAFQMGFVEDTINSVDFQKMEYRKNNRVHAARRVSPMPVLAPHWHGEHGAVDATHSARMLVNRLIAVSHSAGERCPSIVKTVQTRNSRLWEQYDFCRSQMRETHAELSICCETMDHEELAFYGCDESLNEVYLFHGCGPKEAESIAENGFDNKRLTGVRGLSLNFTSSLKRAMTFSESETGEKTIIVARVLLGDIFHNTSDRPYVRRAESRQGNDASPYDSVFTPHEEDEDFQVYDTKQAYPEYILTLQS